MLPVSNCVWDSYAWTVLVHFAFLFFDECLIPDLFLATLKSYIAKLLTSHFKILIKSFFSIIQGRFHKLYKKLLDNSTLKLFLILLIFKKEYSKAIDINGKVRFSRSFPCACKAILERGALRSVTEGVYM